MKRETNRILYLNFFSLHRLKTFRAKLFELFKQEHAQTVSLDKVKGHMGSDFSEDEIFGAIDQMMDANQVMLADDAVFLI